MKQSEEILKTLKVRFEKNVNRHKGIEWIKVQDKLEAKTEKMWSLGEMERTGGEPDVVGFDKKTGEYIFYDCSPESPKDRRNVCYDRAAPSLPIGATTMFLCSITGRTLTMALEVFAAHLESKI